MTPEDKLLNEYHRSVVADRKKREDNHNTILEGIAEKYGEVIYNEYKLMTKNCDIYGLLEIVDTPMGSVQDEETYSVFLEILVDQWSVGMDGDSFSGHIYGKMPDGKWLKIPFEI